MIIKSFLIAGTVALGAAGAGHASPNLVKNGDFSQSSYTTNTQFGGKSGGTYTASQGVTDWTGAGGNSLQFYFFGGTQNTVDAIDRYNDPKDYFYPSFSSLSPNGGNFVALDGDAKLASTISQTITGLKVGKRYVLSFDWAATQLANRTGATTEQLLVTLGGSTASTSVVPNPSKGFTGWFTETMMFTATSGTEVLSFLSNGTPRGLPPIAPLDGVSLTAVPEPAAWVMFVAGFGLVGFTARRRRETVVTA